jgi:hypothetical protein
MKRNDWLPSLFIFLLGLLAFPAVAQSGTTVIDVQTEGSGDILQNTGQVNLNGSMVWNGSEWVVNNTWAHKFFVDTRTGNRLKEYTSQVYQGTDPTGLIDRNYSVTRNRYTYREPARAGSPFCSFEYEAVEYVVQDITTSKTVILRSRGTGNGLNEPYFNIYIEDEVNTGAIQTTALRGDPKWYTYPLSAAEAVNRTSATEYMTGDLPGAITQQGTRAGDYYLDIGGGADLGPAGVGKSFQFHTSTLNPLTTGTVNLGSPFPIDFNLKYMDSSGNLQMMRFLPALVSETPQRCSYLPLILNGLPI